jgi:hypothetical protein
MAKLPRFLRSHITMTTRRQQWGGGRRGGGGEGRGGETEGDRDEEREEYCSQTKRGCPRGRKGTAVVEAMLSQLAKNQTKASSRRHTPTPPSQTPSQPSLQEPTQPPKPHTKPRRRLLRRVVFARTMSRCDGSVNIRTAGESGPDGVLQTQRRRRPQRRRQRQRRRQQQRRQRRRRHVQNNSPHHTTRTSWPINFNG